jgi:hypothetical protein
MSYNAHVAALLSRLGLTSGRLPVAGLAPRTMDVSVRMSPKVGGGGTREYVGLIVWVDALPPHPGTRTQWGYRLHKRSTHRLVCQCPCGRVLSVGRLHQHKCRGK